MSEILVTTRVLIACAYAGIPSGQSMVQEPLSPSQLRIKLVTTVVTGAALAVLLLQDWGEGTVFSGVRPAVKSVLNRALGAQKPSSSSAPASQSDSSGHA